MYEDRSAVLMIVTCRNVESGDVYRTLFIDLEALYFEVEAKAQCHRNKLVRKKERKLAGDALSKAAADFLLARLNIAADTVPWPTLLTAEEHRAKSKDATSQSPVASSAAVIVNAASGPPALEVGTVHLERMCVFNKLSSDAYDFMEVAPPSSYKCVGVEYLKLQPSQTAVAFSSAGDLTIEKSVQTNTETGSSTQEGAAKAEVSATAITTTVEEGQLFDAMADSPKKSKPTVAPSSVSTIKGRLVASNTSKVKPAPASASIASSSTSTTTTTSAAAVTSASTVCSKGSKSGSAATVAAGAAGKKSSGLKNNKIAPSP